MYKGRVTPKRRECLLQSMAHLGALVLRDKSTGRWVQLGQSPLSFLGRGSPQRDSQVRGLSGSLEGRPLLTCRGRKLLGGEILISDPEEKGGNTKVKRGPRGTLLKSNSGRNVFPSVSDFRVLVDYLRGERGVSF